MGQGSVAAQDVATLLTRQLTRCGYQGRAWPSLNMVQHGSYEDPAAARQQENQSSLARAKPKALKLAKSILAQAKPKAKPRSKAKAKPKTKAKTKAKPKPVSKAKAKPKTKTKAKAKPKPVSKAM